ncbi:MAG TPA: hypothetical protein VMS40_11280, partial [Vicinamibacterales bacterium]|nr:hypothetical protein [Vicinamibacterales bacterium]
MRRLALLAAFVLFASRTHAQETSRISAQGPITDSAERIAREFWPTDVPSFSVDEERQPRFRSGVTETIPLPPWQPSQDRSLTPARGAISH